MHPNTTMEHSCREREGEIECVCVCLRACVRTHVRVCVSVCVCVGAGKSIISAFTYVSKHYVLYTITGQ